MITHTINNPLCALQTYRIRVESCLMIILLIQSPCYMATFIPAEMPIHFLIRNLVNAATLLL